jgi:hypothetical protein
MILLGPGQNSGLNNYDGFILKLLIKAVINGSGCFIIQARYRFTGRVQFYRLNGVRRF